MRRLPYLLAFVLAGCQTLSPRDASTLREHNVPPSLQQKMAHGDSLPPADVVELSRRGVPQGLVVNYLESTGAVYALRTRDILALRRDGVPETILDYMLQTPAYQAPFPLAEPYLYDEAPIVIRRR